MRQYEKRDCSEKAKKGQKLEISLSYIPTASKCECEITDVSYTSTASKCEIAAIFGNPKTRNIVWVPFGSKVLIENYEYEIIKGKEYAVKRYVRTKEDILHLLRFKPKVSVERYNRSVKCFLDKDKQLHSMEDFMRKEVLVKEVAGFHISISDDFS
jgi:hypothetical protein